MAIVSPPSSDNVAARTVANLGKAVWLHEIFAWVACNA